MFASLMEHQTEKTPERTEAPEPLITRRELAKLCKVSTRTVDNWVAKKTIPVLRGPSERCVRFAWSDVVKTLKSFEALRK